MNPQDPTINIQLPVSQLQTLLDLAGNGPFNTVAPIIASVKHQAEKQLQALREATAAPAPKPEEPAAH